MTGKELIEQLKDFEDFEIEGIVAIRINGWLHVHSSPIEIGDIGYSDEVLHLNLEDFER